MSKINYKKMYEDTIFDKITLQKEYDEYKNLQENIKNNLIKENDELKEHLKKYTAPKGNKTYYQKNKEKIIENNKKNYRNKKFKKILEEQDQNIEINNNK
jgi:hypothetical protein